MSTYDELLAGRNAAVSKINAMNIDDYVSAAKNTLAANKETKDNTINTVYDALKENAQSVYDKNLSDAKVAYESEYQKNAVQKLINEKQIAEKNANLGLTDSGLNRTQQTAAQLSYANQKGDIDIARQNAIDNLTLELSSALTEIENNRNGDLLTANEEWENNAYSLAQTNYNNDITALTNQITSADEQLSAIEQAQLEADTAVQKALLEAANNTSGSSNNSAIYKINYGELANTTYASNGNVVYTDINGNKVTMRSGTNPFTNTINKDVLDEWGEYDKSKVFSNGYQPNNINGKQLKQYGGATINFNGNIQKVWTTNDEDCYYWDGSANKYIKMSEAEKASLDRKR